MKKRIFIHCFCISLAAVLLCGILSALIAGAIQERELVRTVTLQTAAALRQNDLTEAPQALAENLAELFPDSRVSIIASDGHVLGDSGASPDTMENHLSRPEVSEAAAGRVGVSRRYSSTLGTYMLYIARADEDGTILRVAVPGFALTQNVVRMLPAFAAGVAAALVFSALLAGRTSRAVLRPLSETAALLRQTSEEPGAPEVPPVGLDELDSMVSSINSMSRQISRGVRELSFEKEKTEFILSHMDEGVVLTDQDLTVLYLNRSARMLLGAKKMSAGENLSLLTHHVRILDAVRDTLQGSSQLFDFSPYGDPAGTVLAVKTSPAVLGRDEKTHGALIVLSDVTELRRTEQIRSEFVANASHELKTPITSIRGFAELLASGVVQGPEKVRDYLQRIVRESDRMMSLAEDILMLSALESGLRPEPSLPLDLLAAAREAAGSLAPQAGARNISLSVEGEPCSLYMEPADARHILVNLMENAIRYNHPGGSVTVEVRQLPGAVLLSVEDTGIGIPPRYQARIFERFFRVDKGRSRDMGGTGLGLAIVKHTASLYQGEIALVSREGLGTRIQIRFPTFKR